MYQAMCENRELSCLTAMHSRPPACNDLISVGYMTEIVHAPNKHCSSSCAPAKVQVGWFLKIWFPQIHDNGWCWQETRLHCIFGVHGFGDALQQPSYTIPTSIKPWNSIEKDPTKSSETSRLALRLSEEDTARDGAARLRQQLNALEAQRAAAEQGRRRAQEAPTAMAIETAAFGVWILWFDLKLFLIILEKNKLILIQRTFVEWDWLQTCFWFGFELAKTPGSWLCNFQFNWLWL